MIFRAFLGSSRQVLKYHVKEGRTASLHILSNFNNLYYCLHLLLWNLCSLYSIVINISLIRSKHDSRNKDIIILFGGLFTTIMQFGRFDVLLVQNMYHIIYWISWEFSNQVLAKKKYKPFLCVFEKLLRATINFVMSVWKNLVPTGWRFMKFDFWVFFENLSRKF